MKKLPLTTSQTVGPFFHDALLRPDARRALLAGPATPGQRIRLVGRVLDGDGAGVADALVEIWQANHYGRYNHPADTRDLPLDPDFIGFGRAASDEAGGYAFETVKPGAVPFDATRMQAPHIGVVVFARGLLNHLFTRLYFDDEPANADDPLLARVAEARRPTLLARRQHSHDAVYRFDIVLQGPGETVFFDLSSR